MSESPHNEQLGNTYYNKLPLIIILLMLHSSNQHTPTPIHRNISCQGVERETVQRYSCSLNKLQASKLEN